MFPVLLSSPKNWCARVRVHLNFSLYRYDCSHRHCFPADSKSNISVSDLPLSYDSGRFSSANFQTLSVALAKAHAVPDTPVPTKLLRT